MTNDPGTVGALPRRAVLVGIERRAMRGHIEPALTELGRLADTAGAIVVGEIVQRRERPDSRTYIGKGKVQEVADLVAAADADLILFDNDLTPSQERNLQEAIGCQVIDRSRLILDIFSIHARTAQARMQVELAQLQYMRSRLKRMWAHLDRERLEGSIGSRGPGEKQLEVDRRLVAKRIQTLRKTLEDVEKQQQTRSASRTEFFKISLVGYTNAGKSTLLRQLTGSDALIQDQLFATLDTQTRTWDLPGNQRVFLSDTVGFIRDLPHHLVASFHSTLSEVVNADLLLHVIDASNPDAEYQLAVVENVLGAIGAGGNRSLEVFNKVDAVEDHLLADNLLERHPGAVAISAQTGAGVENLAARVSEIVQGSLQDLEVEVPAGDGRLLAYISEHANVLEKEFDESHVRVRIRMRISPRGARHVRRSLGLTE